MDHVYDHDDVDDDGSLSGESTKSSFRSLNLPKPNIATGINRLFKGFKNFSQIFGKSIPIMIFMYGILVFLVKNNTLHHMHYGHVFINPQCN